MADRAATIRSVALLALILGLVGASVWAVDPPRVPMDTAVPPLPGGPAEVPFPLFDPAKPVAKTPDTVTLPAPRAVGAVTAFQKSQPPQPPKPPDRSDDPFLDPPIKGKEDPETPKAKDKEPATTEDILPEGRRINLPIAPKQSLRFSPRYSQAPSWKLLPSDDENVQKLLYTGGVIISVNYFSEGKGFNEVEFSANDVVAWIKNPNKKKPQPGDLNAPLQGDGKTEVEMYLTGEVVIRQFTVDPAGKRNIDQVMQAQEVYYDVPKNRAVALNSHMQFRVDGLPNPIHLYSPTVNQLGPNEFQALEPRINGSRRPSDPGIQYTARESVFTREKKQRTNIFGIPYRNVLTGEEEFGYEQVLTSYNVKPRFFDTPFFWLPRSKTDLAEPFGPLAGFALGNDQVLGFRAFFTWDLFKLTGLRGRPGDRWQLFTDYLSLRGGAIGTEYNYTGKDLFDLGPKTGLPGFDQPYNGFFRFYMLQDSRKNNVRFPEFDTDQLGGNRGPEPIPPQYRGQIQWRHNQDLYENGTTYLRLMSQIAYISDKNIIELLYKNEFDTGPNQQTFVDLYGATGNLGGSLLYQQRFERPWVTETNWLPKAETHLIGQSFLDTFTYSSRADAGYAQLRPATIAPLPVTVTSRDVETGRFHWNQRLSAPLDLGPVRFTPYGVMDLSYYTQDLRNYNGGFDRWQAGSGGNMPTNFLGPTLATPGDDRARFYGGGGAEASITFSKIFAEVASDTWNLNGLHHKATWRANYFSGYSDQPYWMFPELDRLNDDTTDQAYRTERPRQFDVIRDPKKARELALSPLFDPQQYAIRRMVDGHWDTLDTMQVVQLGLNQRLQTKRGYPGAQHIVDWMTLDLSASYFPDPARDNYGTGFSFLQYDFLWHVGDRLSLNSAGWIDPIENGTRYYNVGLNFNRPDGTNFFLTYRNIDPIGSRVLSGTVGYQLNSKYGVNFSSSFDFGFDQSLWNQLTVTRVGSDATMLLGFSFNPIVGNFGFQFALIPNLAGINPNRMSQGLLFGQR
ncbi:MAG: hypothetical protein ACRC8S_13735 [Fimbriiglobus sp.]